MGEELDRTPSEITKKLEDIRNKILWFLYKLIFKIELFK